VHRIGRTARADTTGTAVTFINEKDQNRFARIEALIGYEVQKLPLPEGFEAGPVYNPKKTGEGYKKKPFRKKKKNNHAPSSRKPSA
jgi:superfamily II DNA/RNA helicase